MLPSTPHLQHAKVLIRIACAKASACLVGGRRGSQASGATTTQTLTAQ